jgi:transposase
MKKNDARKLDHKTLEAMRELAVRQVHDGESPEVVARVLGINRATMYNWLAQYRRGGWSGLKPCSWSVAEVGRKKKLKWIFDKVKQ